MSIKTHWYGESENRQELEIRLCETRIQYVRWHDSGKNPNIEWGGLKDFHGSQVERLIILEFGEEVCREVHKNVRMLLLNRKD